LTAKKLSAPIHFPRKALKSEVTYSLKKIMVPEKMFSYLE